MSQETLNIMLLSLNILESLILVALLFIILHIGYEGSILKKKFADTHEKTVESVQLLETILDSCKK